MVDVNKLKEVVTEYHMLKNSGDPNYRGCKFNNLIAKLLQAWGIQAESNIRGDDNDDIDVAFELGNKHFILEAKWESDPINNDPTSKIKNNLERRFEGTFGIIISMSGYTEVAVKKLEKSRLKNVLLLNREHFDSMIAGFIPPEEMIKQILKIASTKGIFYIPNIAELYTDSKKDIKDINFNYEKFDNLVKNSTDGFAAEVILSDLPPGVSGIATSKNNLVLTHPDGIMEVDFSTKKIKNILPIPKFHKNALMIDDRIYLIRNNGVARIINKRVEVIFGGGYGNICCLIEGSNQAAWVFANGYSNGAGIMQPALIHLGEEIGSEMVYFLDYPPSETHSAIYIDDDKFLIAGNFSIAIFQLHKDGIQKIKDIAVFPVAPSNPTGLIKIDENTILLGCGGHNAPISLSEINLNTDEITPIAKLNLSGTPPLLSKIGGRSGYMLTKNSEQVAEKIVVRWSYD